MVVVASSIFLLTIIAVMFLNANTIKDNLNRFFKSIAFFIVIVGFVNLFTGSAFILMKKIYKHHQKMKKKSQYGAIEKRFVRI